MSTLKRFKIATLGCRTNQYESNAYKNQLEALGYTLAQEGESAEICIVNTCTVTEGADRDSRAAIRKLQRANPGAKIVVTGCFTEQNPHIYRSELKNPEMSSPASPSAKPAPSPIGPPMGCFADSPSGAPASTFPDSSVHFGIEGIHLVVRNQEKEQLINQLFPDEEVPEFKIRHFEAHTRAFVKVQDGCNSFCTYCIIPYVRGRSRSRTIESVVQEVEGLIANGYKEVVLTGINIGDFDGGDGTKRLKDLVKSVAQVDGLERLRLSSIDPDEVDEELMEVLMQERVCCSSLHLVLQSGSNVILKKMNRKYTRQIFQKTVEKLKKADPDFTFTTDIIVGFPGETEHDFQETLQVMQEVHFAKVHMFPYSERARTRAALFPGKVPGEVIAKRKARLLQQAEQSAYLLRERYVGKKMRVLVESHSFGHTENFLPVHLAGKENQIVEVLLKKNSALGLVA